MSLRQDRSGVSEIVGALMLVVVVSSAAFGFGLFLHQQAKATEAQKAADLARKMERVEVTAVAPVDADFAADCTPASASDGAWNSLSVVLTSAHQQPTTIATLRVNGLVVKSATVGATTYDFSLGPADPGYQAFVLQPRQQATVVLANVATDPAGYTGSCASAQPYAFFGTPGPAIATSDAIHVEVLTGLTNDFERLFVPPTATASLEPVAGAPQTYALVGTASQAGTDGGFLVRWDWEYWHATACGAGGTGTALHGHRVQVTGLVAGDDYCARLTVTDDDGLSAASELRFQA